MDDKIYTISELSDYLNNMMAADPILQDLWVRGEVSNFHHHNSGHMYFTLKDNHSCISAIMFRGNNRYLKFELEEGMTVNAHGYVGIYQPRGNYQFYIDQLEPAGKGALYLAFEQLKLKLSQEGLFAVEQKKAIPLLPQKIGVVTSPTGAAIRDILAVARRRFRNVSMLIVPSLVQGEQAASQIVRGIEYLNQRADIDLIIISRGGGTIEDLWPFNEEMVARSIFCSQKPIISGVGHESDYTIADFVADLRAPTPSAAAELALSSRLELEKNLTGIYNRLVNAIQFQLANSRGKLSALAGRRVFSNPQELLATQLQNLDDLSRRLELTMERTINKKREKFIFLNGKLEGLSPLKTLSRGYTITSKTGNIVNSIAVIEQGDLLITRVSDGEILSRVEGKREDELDG
ncbi:MAG: exodeoxyribonuclease VII large subunit [Halanaerobiales bacterium]|nr:exodeoxyribonuclease VII large subunit [Halanaerobiales bacterium]